MARSATYVLITAHNEYFQADFITTQAKCLTALRRIRRSFKKISERGIQKAGQNWTVLPGTLKITTSNLGRHTKRPTIK